MPSAVYDFTNSFKARRACEQGATFTRQLVYKANETTVMDLSGYTARMQVRTSYGATAKILEMTTENTGIELGGTNGTILINVPATLTQALTAGMYLYDLEVASASGVVTRLLEGKFEVTAEVTR